MVKKASKKKSQKPPSVPKPTTTVVSAVVARSTKERSSPPQWKTTAKNGAVRVGRREFVGTVTNGSSTDFCIDDNSISSPGWDFNPGNATMFPWLSLMAPSFERFRFHNLQIELVSSQSTSTPGRIYAAVDYDYDDAPPTTKSQLMGNMTAQEAPIWSNLRISCEASQLHRDLPYKFVNLGTRSVTVEPRTCYSGFLVIGFDTTTANCKFDIFVTYDVSLEVPVFDYVGPVFSNPDPVAPTTPYVATQNPWYSATATGYKFIQPLWSSNATKGLLREVVGSTGDVPPFAAPVGWGGSPGWLQRGIDIARAGRQHWITFTAFLKESGLAPATWNANAYVNAYAYDGDGSMLGPVKANAVSATSGVVLSDNNGGSVPSLGGTTNQGAFSALGVNLDSLRNLWPRIRYLLPFVATLDALGLGSVAATVGIDYRLW